MAEPSLILFEDREAQDWEPFALTRPVAELLFGAYTMRERAELGLGVKAAACVAPEHLVGFTEGHAPPVVTPEILEPDGAKLLLSSRALIDLDARPDWSTLPQTGGPVFVGGEPAGWYAPEGQPLPTSLLDTPVEKLTGDSAASAAGRPALDLPGRVLRRVWELISGNASQTADDIAHVAPDRPPYAVDAGVHHWGDHPLIVEHGVTIEPGAALDCSSGPIWLKRGSTVRAFTRLAGPAVIGDGSTVLGGAVEAVSLGPVCKVRGELSDSVCLGFVNKAHDGHIGHAYLGRWVNLGAETTNSDLKNNYGTIRVWTPSGEVDTGEIKLGSLLGDHVKTGIGLLLNTGTVVGAGSNLYGSEMPPRFVPPFSWGTGDRLTEYKLDRFLEVTERAMERRDQVLGGEMRQQLTHAWRRGREMAAGHGSEE